MELHRFGGLVGCLFGGWLNSDLGRYWTLNVMDDRPPLVGMTLNFLLATPVIGVLWWLNDGAWPPITGFAGAFTLAFLRCR